MRLILSREVLHHSVVVAAAAADVGKGRKQLHSNLSMMTKSQRHHRSYKLIALDRCLPAAGVSLS